jgi:hypothetical protein
MTPRPRLPAWLPAAILGTLLLAGLVVVVLLARGSAQSDVPAPLGPFSPPGAANPTVTYDVERADGGRLTVGSGSDAGRVRVDIEVPAGGKVDVLESVGRADIKRAIQQGDWVTVIGVKNEVKNFSIRTVLIIPGGGTPDGDGFVRTPGGFSGDEAARDSAEAPVLGGPVDQITATGVTLKTAAGTVSLDFTGAAPVRRLRPGLPADIHEGDRVAFHTGADGKADVARGALVLVGGAK